MAYASITILLIEDERKTADTLKKGLEDYGYAVDVAYEGFSGLKLLESGVYDLVISDVVMPVLNGIDLCKQIRKLQADIPILLLTAMSSTDDIVDGLHAGADDYLTKPFDFRELLARVRNLIKRSRTNDVLRFSDIELDLKTKQVTRSGKSIVLTAQELKLLEYFVRNPNKVISRLDLLRDVWDTDFDTGTNIVEVYISYLRNKIDKHFQNKLIHNVHGIGYVLKEVDK